MLYVFLGVFFGLPFAGLVVAAATSVLGGRRFGVGSFALGLVVAIAMFVVVIVIWRTIDGDVTGWDLVWAAGVTIAAVWSLRRLAVQPQPHPDQA